MKRLICVIFSVCFILLGCATEEQLEEHNLEITKRISETQSELGKQHQDIMQHDVERLKVHLEKAEQAASLAIKKAEESYAIAVEKRQELEDFGRIALTVGDMATGGRLKPFIDLIDENKNKVSDVSHEAAALKITAEDLKGMSTEEIIALLVAAGSATGLGGLLGKTGKSREHAAIVELQRRLDLAAEPPTKLEKS